MHWADCRAAVAVPDSLSDARMAGIGASRSEPGTLATVSLLNPQRSLSLGGGNRSSCPISDLRADGFERLSGVDFCGSLGSTTPRADLPLWHPLTRDPSRSLRAADIGAGAMGPRFCRDLEAIAYYWAGRRTPPGLIRPGYGALNFQNVPLIAPSK
jgi:hypothetical protein